MKRFDELSELIEKTYGHLGPYEIDSVAVNYTKAETRMIEVMKVQPNSAVFMDLFEDIEFKPVTVPKDLHALLRPQDTFLATLGYENGKWAIIYLSPPYFD